MGKDNSNVINLTKHFTESLSKDLGDMKEAQDAEAITGEALDEGIRVAIEEGSINFFSLAKTLMSFAESLDNIEYKIALLSIYLMSEDKEKILAEKNIELLMRNVVNGTSGTKT